MGEIARLPVRDYSGAQLKVIKRNNPDLTDDEFNALTEIARETGLSLFRRQLSAIVFGKNAKDKSKRRVAYVIGIDGYRAMADRTGSYMPGAQMPQFVMGEKSPTNPAGIVSCTVYVQKFAHGSWHTFSATAHWDEFAPIETEWKADENGDRKPSGKKLSDNWKKMPHLMIAKVAESQALRRGWPDTFAGLFTEDELERERTLELTATEIVADLETEERERKLGGPNRITVAWNDGKLELIPDGQFADRVMQFLKAADSATEINAWFDRNKEAGFRDYWGRHAGDALELKKAIAARAEELSKEAAE